MLTAVIITSILIGFVAGTVSAIAYLVADLKPGSTAAITETQSRFVLGSAIWVMVSGFAYVLVLIPVVF